MYNRITSSQTLDTLRKYTAMMNASQSPSLRRNMDLVRISIHYNAFYRTTRSLILQSPTRQRPVRRNISSGSLQSNIVKPQIRISLKLLRQVNPSIIFSLGNSKHPMMVSIRIHRIPSIQRRSTIRIFIKS